jgi:hypothetical protein
LREPAESESTQKLLLNIRGHGRFSVRGCENCRRSAYACGEPKQLTIHTGPDFHPQDSCHKAARSSNEVIV